MRVESNDVPNNICDFNICIGLLSWRILKWKGIEMDTIQQDKTCDYESTDQERFLLYMAGKCNQMGEKDGRASQSLDLTCQVGKMQLQSW